MRFYYILVFISLFFNISSSFNIRTVSYYDFIRFFNKKVWERNIPKRELGTGACGKVIEANDTVRNRRVAIKFELMKSPGDKSCFSSYLNEIQVYENIQGGEGIPKMLAKKVVIDLKQNKWSMIVLEKLGRDLESLFREKKYYFSTVKVVNLAMQMINRIEYLHKKKYIHRDIKPGNFLMGRGATRYTLYLSDFGFTIRYDPNINKYEEKQSFIGTIDYASINAHYGISQSRRDDLESIGYVLMYFMTGTLPWKIFSSLPYEERMRKIKYSKKKTPVKDMCKKCPEEFHTYLVYCKGLRFDEEPDYRYLYKLFKRLYDRLNIKIENPEML